MTSENALHSNKCEKKIRQKNYKQSKECMNNGIKVQKKKRITNNGMIE